MKKQILFLAVFTAMITQAQVSLVKDINPGVGIGVSTAVYKYNDKLLFTGGVVNDYNLWISDGTTSGTVLLKDLGGANETPRDYYHSNLINEVFFISNTPLASKFWKTDGTTSGTENITTTNLWLLSNTKMIDFNDDVYFRGQTNRALMKTDGTDTGTVVISTNCYDARAYFEFNGSLYISAGGSPGAAWNRELWISDGTSAGTQLLKDIYVGGSSAPDLFFEYEGVLYFTAEDNISGRELWKTDGTETGTVIVDDINSGTGSSSPSNFTLYNNEIYFIADDGNTGFELFKLDAGGNVTQVVDINQQGSAGSNPSNLTVYNNKLYYAADDGINGTELWYTHVGTSSGKLTSTTALLKDINVGSANPDSSPSGFTEYDGKLYFAATDDINGRELWETDGTVSGTLLVEDINVSGDGNPTSFNVVNNRLLFTAENGTVGRELFKLENLVLSIQESDLSLFSIYPNPVTNSFKIKTKEIIESVALYDITGKLIKKYTTPLASYKIENLSNGVYFVKIQSGKGTTTKKIIKQ